VTVFRLGMVLKRTARSERGLVGRMAKEALSDASHGCPSVRKCPLSTAALPFCGEPAASSRSPVFGNDAWGSDDSGVIRLHLLTGPLKACGRGACAEPELLEEIRLGACAVAGEMIGSVDQLLKGISVAYAFVQERRIAVALLVVVASATICSAASSRPSRTTFAPAAGTKYISKRYGYEIVLGGKYGIVPALEQWVGDFPFGASGQVDVIVDVQDRKFVIAKPVSSGMSLSQWEAFVVKVKRQACHGLRNFRASSLGGVPAREFVNTCPGYDVITLAAIHGGRGYLLEYVSPTSFSAASDRRTYEAGRRAFRFTEK
jgi:hypothetical protein